MHQSSSLPKPFSHTQNIQTVSHAHPNGVFWALSAAPVPLAKAPDALCSFTLLQPCWPSHYSFSMLSSFVPQGFCTCYFLLPSLSHDLLPYSQRSASRFQTFPPLPYLSSALHPFSSSFTQNVAYSKQHSALCLFSFDNVPWQSLHISTGQTNPFLHLHCSLLSDCIMIDQFVPY